MRRRLQPLPTAAASAPTPLVPWPAAAEKVSLFFLALFLFLLPLGPAFQGYMDQSDLLPMRIIAVIALAPLSVVSQAGRARGQGGFGSLALGCLVLWVGFTGALTYSRHDTFLQASDLGVGICAYLAVRWHRGSQRGSMWLLAALIAGATATALLGIQNYAATYRTDPTWRIFSTFQNPNFLASYLILVAPITLAAALELSRPWVLPTAAAAIFQFSALMLTGSRGGWLSLSVGLAVMVVVGVRRLKEGSGPRLLVIAGILVALTPALALPTARRVATSSEGEQASSMAFRRLTWRGTLDQALAHPLLGTGYGTFEISYPQYARAGYTKLAHNSYLQLAAETGFPGMLLMLAAIGAGLWACLSPNVLRKWGWPVAGLAGGITAFALHNCFESTLYVPPCSWTFLALLGASTQPMPAGSQARAKEILWSGLALAGAVLALLGAPAGVGQSSAAEAQTLRERGDLNGSLVSLDEALRWDPRNPQWRIQRAETLLLTGRRDAGLTQFARLAESEPHRAQVYHRWGLALQALGDPRRARDRYHQAVALEPNRTESLLKLAQVDELLGDVPAARRCYEALVALERGPVGRVRALAGYVNLDYAEAYLALARLSTGPADLGKRREMAHEASRIASEFLRDMTTWKATLQSVGQWRPEREARAKQIAVESLRLGG